jgi:hypothetical protein
MTDQTSDAVVEKPVETVTTETSSPQVENPITGGETTDSEHVDQGSEPESPESLPEDTEEQRRAFQQMRLENKRLKEQLEQGDGKSAFSAFRPQQPPVSQPVRIENFTDPTTGETNWQAYQVAQTQREQQTINQATFAAQQATQEILDENNARSKYPEQFKDKNFEQRVADRWIAAKLRGENPTISNIADDEARLYGKVVSKAEKIGAEKALNEVSEKEKAGLSVSGQTSQPAQRITSQEEFERLRVKTRLGDDAATTARLSKIPWANK